MGRERKCILCELVCSSKQEMNDHMRTMLHHRELEKLKGRDCGHDCSVCRVTVVGLTEYAGHISSRQHKLNVEASEGRAAVAGARDGEEMDYFDQALMDLIQKRKELIRKDEEAAAAAEAQLAREESERRRQQDFQDRLREAKERFRLNLKGRKPPRGYGAPRGPEAWGPGPGAVLGPAPGWGSSTHPAARGAEDPRVPYRAAVRTNGRGGEKSATWHAAAPAPGFQAAVGQWAGGSLGSGSKGFGPGDPFGLGAPRGRHPWLSNQGSSNGLYGRNNIRQQPPMGPPLNLGPLCGPARPPSPAGLFTPRPKGSPDLGGAGAGECHRGNDPGPKSHGPPGSKPDRACRWSPYPPTAAAAKAPEREAPAPPPPPPPPPPPDVPRTCHGGRGPARPGPVQREERPGRAGAAAAAAVAVGDRKKTKPPKMDEDRKRSTSGGRPSGGGGAQKEAHRDGPSACSSGPPKPPPDGRKLAPKDRKFPLNPPSSTDKPRPDRPPGREKKQPPPPQPPKPKTTSSRAGPAGPLQSRQDQQIPDQSGVARPERRGSEGAVTGARRKETPPPPPPPPPAPAPSSAQEEARPQVSPESREGADKENKRRMSGGGGGAKDLLPLPDLVRPSHRGPTARTHADCSEYLQSVHVSTSSSCAPETPTPVVSSTQEEKEQQQRRRRQQQEEEEEESSSTPKAPQNPSGGLTRLGLPPVLSKHMGAKGSKVPAHEPNLHGARRVRHVGDGGGGGGEKESGLKPTVRQLISSSGSRRNVNWEQVYQEVRKKQGQGKGCPRFGIEMVSCDQEDPAAGEDPDAALLEGFHWDSLLDSAPCLAPRKRSLSESSVAPARPASSLGLFSCQVSGEPGGGPSGPEEDREAEEHKVFSNPGASEPAGGVKEEPEQPGQEPMEVGAPGPAGAVKEGRGAAPPRKAESLEVGGPGAELLDATAMGKKRRAAGDISSPEIHSLKKNKRMKIKSKKERFHVDQLLAVSLREEELSLSLQTLDMGLIQARSTLQAAYMEVQRIMVEKNQVSTEMAALRNQRIELLKGIQGVFEEPAAAAAAPQVKQESGVFDSPSPSAAAAVDVSIPLARPAPPSTLPTLPPRHGTPDDPGVVKQEPLSPVQVGGVGLDHQEPAEIRITLVHSTAPLTPAPLNAPILTDAVKLQWSPDRGPVADPPSARPQKVPAPCKDSPPAAVAIAAWNATPDRCGGARQDCKLEPEPWASPRRTSEVGNHGDGTIRSDESGTSPEAPPPPRASTASPEMRNGFAVKRVRRLRKRRVLNKVQGAEPAAGAATSEEEEEDDEAKPRRPRPRRRSSAGSVVSTSALPTGPEDEEHGAVEEEEEEEEESPGPTAGMGEKEKEEEFDSALEMVEVGKEEANADWSGPEEAMEVTLGLGLGPGPVAGLPPDPSRSRSLNLACNEVTSTSDMDTSAGGPPCPSDGQAPFPPAKDHKTKLSSDASSDPGDDEPPTEGTFEGHKEAVNDLQIHRGLLYTCSGDRTVKAFDLVTHECVAVFEGHLSKVNCMLVLAAPGLPHRLYSGSSDQRVRCYSLKTRVLEQQYVVPHRVLCLHSRWKVLYAGLANGTVATFNLKTNRPMEVFECHGPRAVSCLTSAQEGARKVLLVGSYDSTISVRDARNGLLLRTLEGHAKTVLCMKVVNDLVFSGSSDHSVHAHNIHTGELVRVYKGHSHAVSVVAILGKVMLTASLDKLVRVYELQSHDRLQVYGGHKDMVMCMTVHKSMIYTGCYDGSVQAVKLNLLQNYRCMWQGCPLIFGVLEHLRQHLEDAHANPSFQTLKCRWKNCDELFCARNGAKPGVATHMQKHIDELASSDP